MSQGTIPDIQKTPAPPPRDVRKEMNADDITDMTTEQLIEWLQQRKTLPRSIPCPKCKASMTLSKDASSIDGYIWTCRAHDDEAEKQDKMQKKKKRPSSEYRCNTKRSLRSGTFFNRCKLTLHQAVKFVVYWVDNIELQLIEKYVRISHRTAVDWSNFCREVVYDAMIERSAPIGGRDENGMRRVVEIDESKFGKRKYNKGRLVEGKWVFGGYERGSGKIFLVPVKNRTKKTLIALIKKWILPDTVIISDGWASYKCLKKIGYIHYTVNHDKCFKDPITGAHTNAIESTWRHTDVSLPSYRRNPTFFAGYLAKYMFRKKVRADGADATPAFFEAAGKLYNPLVKGQDAEDDQGGGDEDEDDQDEDEDGQDDEDDQEEEDEDGQDEDEDEDDQEDEDEDDQEDDGDDQIMDDEGPSSSKKTWRTRCQQMDAINHESANIGNGRATIYGATRGNNDGNGQESPSTVQIERDPTRDQRIRTNNDWGDQRQQGTSDSEQSDDDDGRDEDEVWEEPTGGELLTNVRPVWYNYATIHDNCIRARLWQELFKALYPAGTDVPVRTPNDFEFLRMECSILMLNHQKVFCQPPQRDTPIQQLLVLPFKIHRKKTVEYIEYVLPPQPEIRYISLNTKRPYTYDRINYRWMEPKEYMPLDGYFAAFEPFAERWAEISRYCHKYEPPFEKLHLMGNSRTNQNSGHHSRSSFFSNSAKGDTPLRIPLPHGHSDDDELPRELEQMRLTHMQQRQLRVQAQFDSHNRASNRPASVEQQQSTSTPRPILPAISQRPASQQPISSQAPLVSWTQRAISLNSANQQTALQQQPPPAAAAYGFLEALANQLAQTSTPKLAPPQPPANPSIAPPSTQSTGSPPLANPSTMNQQRPSAPSVISNYPSASPAPAIASSSQPSAFEDQLRAALREQQVVLRNQQAAIDEQREALIQVEQRFSQQIASVDQRIDTVDRQVVAVGQQVTVVGQQVTDGNAQMMAGNAQMMEAIQQLMAANREVPAGYQAGSMPNINAAANQPPPRQPAYHQSMANVGYHQQPQQQRIISDLASIHEDHEQHYHVPAEVMQQRRIANLDAPPPGSLQRTPSALDMVLAKGKVPQIGLEKYDGTDKAIPLTQWFGLYEAGILAMYADTTEAQLVNTLRFFMAGEAAIWLNEHLKKTPHDPPAWKDLKIAMVKRFQITDESYLFDKFQEAKPMPNEDLREFGSRLERLIYQALPDSSTRDKERQLIRVFKANLPEEIMREVATYLNVHLKASFDDITMLASKLQLTSPVVTSHVTPKPIATVAVASAMQQQSNQQFNQQSNYQPHRNNNYQSNNRQNSSPNSNSPTSPANHQISESPITGYQYDSIEQPSIPWDVQKKQCRECSDWGHVRAHCPLRSACSECGRNPGHGQLRCPTLYAKDIQQARQSIDQECRRLGQNPTAPPYVQQDQSQSQAPASGTNVIVGRVQFDNNHSPAEIFKFEQLMKKADFGSSMSKKTEIDMIINEGYDSGFDNQETVLEQSDDDSKSTSSISSFEYTQGGGSVYGKVVGRQLRTSPGSLCGKVVADQSILTQQRDLPRISNISNLRQEQHPKPNKKKRRTKKRQQQPIKDTAISRSSHQSNRIDQFYRMWQRFINEVGQFMATCGHRTNSDSDASKDSTASSDQESQ